MSLPTVADTSVYVYAFDTYVYGEEIAELREEITTKLSPTDSAGRSGRRIGENFQDIKRYIVAGQLDEDDEANTDGLPLRAIVQRFKFAHRPTIELKKLYLNSAADGRPAEFVWAAVENVTGLKWESPINYTQFEISFACEPEIWYDEAFTVDLRVGRDEVGHTVGYATDIIYKGPDEYFFADESGLPLITLEVSDVSSEQVGTDDPPYIEINNLSENQVFRIYINDTGTYIIDSYKEGIRSGTVWDTADIYELADYDQFIYLVGAATSAGVSNHIILTCVWCDVSTATLEYFARHF